MTHHLDETVLVVMYDHRRTPAVTYGQEESSQLLQDCNPIRPLPGVLWP
jgi:hypothetical protein